MGTWPDRLQYSDQPLLAPWFLLKEALVLHSRPAPCMVGLVRSLWVELAHLEPTEAQWEGEGTAVLDDDWWSQRGQGFVRCQNSLQVSCAFPVCGNARESGACGKTCFFNLLLNSLQSSSALQTQRKGLLLG